MRISDWSSDVCSSDLDEAQSSLKKSAPKAPAERLVKDIRRATRRHFSAEDKIRIVLEGLRGEDSIAELCCKDVIAQSRSEEHTSELQSLMRISYAVFCLKKKNKPHI